MDEAAKATSPTKDDAKIEEVPIRFQNFRKFFVLVKPKKPANYTDNIKGPTQYFLGKCLGIYIKSFCKFAYHVIIL